MAAQENNESNETGARYSVAAYYQPDEINTIDLLIYIWKRKWVIAATTLLSLLGSWLLIERISPVYSASAVLLPPALSELEQVNKVVVVDLYPEHAGITPQEALFRSLVQIDSKKTTTRARNSMHKTAPELSHTDGPIVKLMDSGKYVEPYSITSARLIFEHSDPRYAQEFLERLTFQANKDAVEALRQEIEFNIGVKLDASTKRLEQAILASSEDESTHLATLITDLRLEVNLLKQYSGLEYSLVNMLELEQPIELPAEPSTRKIKLILALFLMGGLLFGVALTLILRAMSIRSELKEPTEIGPQ